MIESSIPIDVGSLEITLTNLSKSFDVRYGSAPRTNRKYVFCIMINDSKTSESDKKMLEEYIIRAIYTCG